MTDFKVGTEVVHHHGKQTEPQAVAHFQAELHDFNKKISGNNPALSHDLADFNFKKLDTQLHQSHKGSPAELDAHMHASSVFKIDGKMQLVFTDDLYDKNHKSKDNTQHAYTIDEKTGKINAVFDIRHSEKGEKVLVRSGPTETFTRDHDGNFVHNVQNEKGKYETHGGAYSKVTVGDDGAVTTNRTTGDFSTTTYPDGRSVERNGTDGGGNIVRTKDGKGHEVRLNWGENPTLPESIRYVDKTTPAATVNFEMERMTTGFRADDIYKSHFPSGDVYWKVSVDKSTGVVQHRPVLDKELEEQRIVHPRSQHYEGAIA